MCLNDIISILDNRCDQTCCPSFEKSEIAHPTSEIGMTAMLKDIILWKYERASWQWDLLCFLIILFIFLTPKQWFDRKETLATQTSRLIVKAKDFSPDRNELEKRVRLETGDPNAEIIKLNERTDARGETFYEIEVR